MQLFQARVADGELNLGKVAVEQFHVVPRDDAFVDALAERLGDAAGGFFHPRSQAAQNAANAHFCTKKAQLRSGNRELQVVYAHNLHALRVYDLPIEQVARKEHFGRLKVAEADGGAVDFQANALVFVEAVHVFTPRDHERRFARSQECQAGDAREHFAGLDGQVGYGTDFFTICINDGFAEHLR